MCTRIVTIFVHVPPASVRPIWQRRQAASISANFVLFYCNNTHTKPYWEVSDWKKCTKMNHSIVVFVVSDGKLYWFDTGLKYIASMNLDDGSDRQTLIASISAHFLDMIVAGDELLVSYEHRSYVRAVTLFS